MAPLMVHGRSPTDESQVGQQAYARVTADGYKERADFNQLFAELGPHVWRMVRGLGVRDADIEDVCQEVFMVVHRKLDSFEGRSSLRTWVYGVALRVVSDYRKKAHRSRERLVAEVPEQVGHASPEADASRHQAWRRLNEALDTLSEDRRQVFVLYEIEQLSMREIADIVKCPLQTAYSRLEAARESVQRVMCGGGEDSV